MNKRGLISHSPYICTIVSILHMKSASRPSSLLRLLIVYIMVCIRHHYRSRPNCSGPCENVIVFAKKKPLITQCACLSPLLHLYLLQGGWWMRWRMNCNPTTRGETPRYWPRISGQEKLCQICLGHDRTMLFALQQRKKAEHSLMALKAASLSWCHHAFASLASPLALKSKNSPQLGVRTFRSQIKNRSTEPYTWKREHNFITVCCGSHGT